MINVHFITEKKYGSRTFWEREVKLCDIDEYLFPIFPCKVVIPMVILLDGNSEIGAHVWSNNSCFVFLRHLLSYQL